MIFIKKSKQILIFVLSLLILFSVFPSTVFAKSASAVGEPCTFKGFYDLSDTVYAEQDGSVGSSNWFRLNFKQNQVYLIQLSLDSLKTPIDAGDTVSISFGINNGVRSRYSSFGSSYFSFWSKGSTHQDVNADYDASTSTFTASFVSENDVSEIVLVLNHPVTSVPMENFVIGLTDVTYETKSEQQGFFDNIKEWFSNLFELLISKFSQLGQNISDLGSKIGNFFSSLTESIRGFFSDLGQNIKEQFNTVISNLRTWFSNIGDWFANLGSSISGFFEKLWNRIYWGNENGQSEYQKPVISNKLNDILDTLDGYQLQLKGSIDTIGAAAEDVSQYISTGSSVITGILNVGGIGFTALIVFGIVFVLVRKVVGR